MRLFSTGHVLQVRNYEANLAVAEIVWRKWRHRLGRPGAHSFRVADQIVQSRGVRYSVGFWGKLRSGPTSAALAPFSLWQVRH
jgi:hypothetical protein